MIRSIRKKNLEVFSNQTFSTHKLHEEFCEVPELFEWLLKVLLKGQYAIEGGILGRRCQDQEVGLFFPQANNFLTFEKEIEKLGLLIYSFYAQPVLNAH